MVGLSDWFSILYIQKVNLPGEADVDDGLAQLGDVLGAATVYADVASSVIEGGVEEFTGSLFFSTKTTLMRFKSSLIAFEINFKRKP